MSNKNGLLKSILPWVVLLFLIGGLVTYMNQGNSKEIKYSEFVEVVQDEKIKEVEIVPSSLVVDVSGKYTKKVDGKSTEYEFTTTIPMLKLTPHQLSKNTIFPFHHPTRCGLYVLQTISMFLSLSYPFLYIINTSSSQWLSRLRPVALLY